jgi:hypothetical protein
MTAVLRISLITPTRARAVPRRQGLLGAGADREQNRMNSFIDGVEKGGPVSATVRWRI